MKRCPQCNSVYEDEISFCAKDGATLVDENFVLPSAEIEEDTIIRTNPIVINLEENEQIPHHIQVEPPAENVIVVPANNDSSNKKYVLFLLIGLLIGGFLVLAALMFSRGFFKNDKAAVSVAENKEISETENLNTAVDNENTIPIASDKHSETNTAIDESALNGRVITLNAHVRYAPDANAEEIEVLPENDRIKIIRRENPKSPWYKVECEHGTNGWMHGNTIEFTDSY